MSEDGTPPPVSNKPVDCRHCGGQDFSTKVFRAPPGEFDLRNPTAWLGTLLTAYVCASCGHVEFFADRGR